MNDSFCLSLRLAVLFLLLGIAPSYAQATRTWVSGVGDDANPCSRTAPCKTFAGAISKTAAGGAINCLDPGGFGGVTITKAISIACESVEAGVLVAGTNGITVSAGASDVVILRGLDIEGVGSGLNGIQFNTGAALHVERCIIRGFLGSPGHGINFAPTGASQISVQDTVITDNNKSATSAAIFIQPSGTGTASGIIGGVSMLNNGNGLIADGTLTTGVQITIVLRNSVSAGNSSNGVTVNATAGKAATVVLVDHTTVTSSSVGLLSSGQGADLTLAYSMVGGNSTGLSFTAPAQLRTYQTNQLRENTVTNGTSSSAIPLE
jgi:hypothetical protein